MKMEGEGGVCVLSFSNEVNSEKRMLWGEWARGVVQPPMGEFEL